MCDPVDTTGAFLMDNAPTNISVIPVNYPYSTLGACIHIETKEMLVISNHEVASMCASKTGPSTLQIIHV